MLLFILNLSLALLWLFLSPAPSLVQFGIGFVLGFALLALFSSLLPEQTYVRRSLALGRFLAWFTFLVLKSNVVLAAAVLWHRQGSLAPGLLTYDATGLTRLEVLLLAHCIGLTPGTTTAEISPDFRTLTVHAFDAANPAAVRESIERDLQRKILAFTR